MGSKMCMSNVGFPTTSGKGATHSIVNRASLEASRRTRISIRRALRAWARPLMALVALGAATLCFPADEIHWTVTGATSVTFDWRGPEDTIQYGLTSGYGQTVIAQTPNPLPFSSAGPFWEARLTGLQEDTVYHYSIGTGPDHTFRTPRPQGESCFKTYVEGDIGDVAEYPNVGPVQGLIAADPPAFVLAVGDLTYGDVNGAVHVDNHFNDVMVWSQDGAYMPAWGNHEDATGVDDFRNYKGRFDFPNPKTSPGAPIEGCCGEDWYWFDYGNVRFIAYPEPYPGAWSNWRGQAEALMDEAQDDPSITFIVTFGHRPAYSSGANQGNSALKGYLDALACDHSKYVLNLAAHSHHYERSTPQAGSGCEGDAPGVVHMVTGTGGNGLQTASSTPPSWSAFRAVHTGALRLRFFSNGIEGAFICGPSSNKDNITCTQGSVVDSFTIGSIPTSDATCDGVDDDCDGVMDDDYLPVGTSCGVGACSAIGTISCVGGTVTDNCTPGTPAASDPTCNGVDDDCDGLTDEGYAPVGTSCGVGACSAIGTTSCVSGTVMDSCTPGTPAASDPTCDGVDDDCDGVTDEDNIPVGTSCGVGACAATGTTSCVGGVVIGSCTPGTPAASDPTCDGVDDDCDGVTDEDNIPVETSCGVGACAATGTTSCMGGVVIHICTPGVPAASDATCDGVDDDCDGGFDEDTGPRVTFYRDADGDGYAGATSGTVESCAAPVGYSASADDCDDQAAATHVGAAELCDAADNDCDGSTDEGFNLGSSCSVLQEFCQAEGRTACRLDATGTVCDTNAIDLFVNHVEGAAQLSWNAPAPSSGYDVVRGSLGALLGSAGDFTLATERCLGAGLAVTFLLDPDVPVEGDGFWYFVRGSQCGAGSYDRVDRNQVGLNNDEIDASSSACP